jgi:adenosylmethionine-8-amino-7-oxononanoate aminotransferase
MPRTPTPTPTATGRWAERVTPTGIASNDTHVFPRFLDLDYPSVERGDGVWLTTTDGRRILDACSGGAMVACLGHGVPEIVEAAAEQAGRISYFYNHHFTSEPQERLADRLLEVVAPGMARVRLVSGGSEANETALQLARLYHVERGETDRWRVISQAQAYHGSTMGTLALTGRHALKEPYTPYLASHLYIAPSTWRSDPSGEAALQELDRRLEEAGPETVSAFFCEPVSAAALPAASPPDRFWEGLAERRDEHGFLICFDEVVSGIGRVGTWLAADQLPIEPDIVSIGKGLGAGYAPLGAVLCRQHVYEAIDRGSREFDLGHTWDGAPLSSAVGLAVLDLLVERGLVERVHDRGPGLRNELETALEGSEIVREVRGRGFLLGVELVDPRDGQSFLPVELDAASLVDDTALEHGLLVTSTHPQVDGFAGDQTLLAPAYVSTDEELAEVVDRFRATMESVERSIKDSLSAVSEG